MKAYVKKKKAAEWRTYLETTHLTENLYLEFIKMSQIVKAYLDIWQKTKKISSKRICRYQVNTGKHVYHHSEIQIQTIMKTTPTEWLKYKN